MGRQSRGKQQRGERTQLGLMAEVLAAASGKPLSQVESLIADFMAVFPGQCNDAVISHAEYRDRRAALMSELPAIRAWLAKGAACARADPSKVREFQRLAASRN